MALLAPGDHKGRPSSAMVAPSSPPLALTKEKLDAFQPSKVYGPGIFGDKASVTSLCYDDRGDYLVSAASDETIHLWSCRNGKHLKVRYSKKYGVDLARFTHRSASLIYASTKTDNTIRQLSIDENKYLQYFRGHEARVTSLQMSPTSEAFLSAAVNESVRLWDLRTSTCQGLFPLQGHPLVAIDPQGIVFAIALNENACILLYDLRNFTNKPFSVIPLEDDQQFHAQSSYPPRIPVITSLAFSPSGIGLLVGTAGNVHYVVDSHTGYTLHRLRNHEGLEKAASTEGMQELDMVPETGLSGQECGWTPDGRFVFSGSSDNLVRFWHITDYTPDVGGPEPPLTDLFPVSELAGHPTGPTRAVAFNPRYAMFASASSQVALWLPDLDEIV